MSENKEPAAEKTLKERAIDASNKYGREITPEQVLAVDYFAKKEAKTDRFHLSNRKPYSSDEHTDRILEQGYKEAQIIEDNCRDSLFRSGNLNNLVAKYYRETEAGKVKMGRLPLSVLNRKNIDR